MPNCWRVVEHDSQIAAFGEEPDEVDDLLLGASDEVRRGHYKKIEADTLRMGSQRKHLRGRCVGDVGRDGPVAARFFGDYVVDTSAFIVG